MPATSGTRHGNGFGWGGPAKGAGKGGAAKPFTIDTPTRVFKTVIEARAERPSGAVSGYELRKLINEERAQELKDHLYSIATTARHEITQVRAAEAWLNRHEGMPVARNLNINVDDVANLSDTDLDAEITRRINSAGQAVEGEEATPVQE